MGIEARHHSLARTRLISAMAGVGVVSLAVAGAGAFAANADTTDVAESQGRFLQGSALGVDLDDIVGLLYAEAGNPSLPVSSNVGVTAEALNALVVDLGSINLLGDNGLITLGAVEQRADATAAGDAFAGSGAVTDEGAIAIDETPDPGFANASVTLDSLLDEVGGEDLISELSLEVGALAATAAQVDGATPTSAYMIADLGFALETSVVTELSDALTGILGTLETTLETTLSGAALTIDLAGLATIEGSVDVTLPALSALITTPITVDGVTIDLGNGTVTVDLVALLAAEGIDINSLPANTNLVTYLPEILQALLGTVDAVVAQFVTSLTTAITGLSLAGNLDISVIPVLPGDLAGIDLAISGTLLDPVVTATGTGLLFLLNPLLDVLELTVPQIGDLVAGLLGAAADGILATLASTLEAATGGIVTAAEPLIDDVLDVIAEVVSLTVNAQPTAAGGDGDLGGTSFTVRALSIGILPTVGAGTLATVDLASATVRGSGLAADVDADTVGDGDADTDSDSDTDTDVASDGGGGGLADTGFDGTWLVGLALLLLVTGAGALLARKVARH